MKFWRLCSLYAPSCLQLLYHGRQLTQAPAFISTEHSYAMYPVLRFFCSPTLGTVSSTLIQGPAIFGLDPWSLLYLLGLLCSTSQFHLLCFHLNQFPASLF